MSKRADKRVRQPREDVRVYGASRAVLHRIMAATGHTRTDVVRDALARYEAELIDNGELDV